MIKSREDRGLQASSNKAFRVTGYIGAFLLPAAVTLFVIYMASAYPFGSASILYGDANDQYYAMLKELIRWFHEGNLQSIIWDRGLGADFYANMLYYGMSPFNIIVILLGEDRLQLSMVLLIVIKTGLITLSAFHFFMKTQHYRGAAGRFRTGLSFTLACAFGLSGYVLAYGHSIIWLDGLIMLPLIALAIERLAWTDSPVRYIIFLGLSIIFNFYFAIFLCIFSVLYFLICLEKLSKRKVLRFILASVFACLLAAVVLVPAILNISQGASYDDSYNNSLIPLFGDITGFIESFYPMQELNGDGGYLYVYNNYCGAFVLICALLFMAAPGSRRDKAKFGCVLALLVLAENVKWINYIFHGFSYPHGLSNRFGFVLIFILLIMCFRFLSGLKEIRLKDAAMAVSSVAVISIFIMLINTEKSSVYAYLSFFAMLMIYGVLLVLLGRKSIRISTFRKWLVSLWCLEIIISACVVAPDKRLAADFETSIGLDYFEETYASLETEDGERKSALSTADDMSVSEVNWYSSMGNGSALDSFMALGLSYYQDLEYTYRGTTPVSTLLYNVRYVMTRELGTLGGYHYVETDGTENEIGMYLYEADETAGMGFVMDADAASWEADGDPFENQNSLMKLACGIEDDIFTEVIPDDVSYQVLNLQADELTADTCYYTGLSDDTSALLIAFTADSDIDDLYLWSSDSRQQLVEIYVDGVCVMSNEYMETAAIAHAGEINAGSQVIIVLYSGAVTDEQGIKEWKLYSFNQEVYAEALSSITDEELTDVLILGNEMTANIECAEDGILYLSIPYAKGYDIEIDGADAELIKIGSGLSGVSITSGGHNISITYHTPGLKAGAIISLAALAILISYCIYKRKRKEDGK